MEIDMSAYREASKIGLVDIIAFKKGKKHKACCPSCVRLKETPGPVLCTVSVDSNCTGDS
jgi:hypothetical protein